ncbi:MAG: PDZ domain-containing protein [Planctomycetes bacterium]|nr:PDZ domain-containing protein [Planctomycetota bacterium]
MRPHFPDPRALIAFALLALGTAAQEAAPESEPATATSPSQPPRTAADLGIEFAVLASKIRRSIISTDTPYGFAVAKVAKGSLAADAGIAHGTIVLEVDGVPLREVDELDAVLAEAEPGQKVTLLCSSRKKVRRLFDRKPWVEKKVVITLPGAADAGDAGDVDRTGKEAGAEPSRQPGRESGSTERKKQSVGPFLAVATPVPALRFGGA